MPWISVPDSIKTQDNKREVDPQLGQVDRCHYIKVRWMDFDGKGKVTVKLCPHA
jgi:hypothetical protein